MTSILVYLLVAVLAVLVVRWVMRNVFPDPNGGLAAHQPQSSLLSMFGGSQSGPAPYNLNKPVDIEETEFSPSRFVDVTGVHTNDDQSCTVCATDYDADSYIRKRLLTGSSICGGNPDLDNYRDDFFGMRNQIWQPSADVDMVDRINDMYLSGNEDVSRNHRGLKIKDLFTQLTSPGDLYGTPCSDPDYGQNVSGY